MSGFKIIKKGYSAAPWRIVDADGKEFRFERHDVFMHGQDMRLPVCGYDTKTEAIDALGRLAALLLERLRVKEADT